MSPHLCLIVDDDAVIRLVIRRTLARLDPHAIVFSAATVNEARQYLGQTLLHLVITDYHLQDGTGLDVLVAALAHGRTPKVVVISGDLTCKESVLAAGAAAFLPKPFTPGDLLDLIRRL